LHSHHPIDEANGDMLHVAALGTVASLTEDEWSR
jgi:hypothetical protein